MSVPAPAALLGFPRGSLGQGGRDGPRAPSPHTQAAFARWPLPMGEVCPETREATQSRVPGLLHRGGLGSKCVLQGTAPSSARGPLAQGQASGPRLRPGEQSCGRLLTAPAPPVPPHAARLSGSRYSHPPRTAESGSREQRTSASLRGFSTVRVLRGKQDGRPRDAHSPGSSAWGPEGRGEEVQPATSSAHLAQRCPTRRGSRRVLGLRGQR